MSARRARCPRCRALTAVAIRARVAGLGLTGLAPGADPAVLERLARAAGL